MKIEKKRIGIVGASGYTGSELLRLVSTHPGMELVFASAHSMAGAEFASALPHLALAYPGMKLFSEKDAHSAVSECDLIFLALPHGESTKFVKELKSNLKIIDLGNDFRLKDAATYLKWQGKEHLLPEQLDKWQYGLPEIFGAKISKATKVANPGCYATAISLGIAPLLKEGLIEPEIVASCVSGASGAGKGLSENLHFSHANENVYAYKIGVHQHVPEIEQTLGEVAARDVTVSFIPHVVPIDRGIHATLSAKATTGASAESVSECFRDFYQSAPFVGLTQTPPNTKMVRGSNNIYIHSHFDSRLGRVTVTAVIDNLVKGAAGQALQNFNLLFGFEETLGIPRVGFYP